MGLLWIDVFDQAHRSLDVGEQHRDGLRFSVESFGDVGPNYANRGLFKLCREGRRGDALNGASHESQNLALKRFSAPHDGHAGENHDRTLH
jgi:hypothetical protein